MNNSLAHKLFHKYFLQRQLSSGVLKEKGFWKYAANLQENTHANVWFHIFRAPFPRNTSGGLLLFFSQETSNFVRKISTGNENLGMKKIMNKEIKLFRYIVHERIVFIFKCYIK